MIQYKYLLVISALFCISFPINFWGEAKNYFDIGASIGNSNQLKMNTLTFCTCARNRCNISKNAQKKGFI